MKVIGQVFVVLGALVLGFGVWLWFAGHDLALPAGRLWFTIDTASLNLVQAIVQRYVYADLWDAAFVPFLLLPGWGAILILILGCFAIGGLFFFLSARRRRGSFRR